MSILSDNMRFLRSQKTFSQQRVADDLIITRARYSKYEEGTEPPLDILQRISRYYQVSIDLLIGVDLRKVPIEDLVKLEGNRVLLPITVDTQGGNYIEIIPYKAKAGYLTGYNDPEFIENLPRILIPFLGPGTFRGFPVEGDSMPPHNDESIIVAEYIESLTNLKPDKTYILLTRSEGMVYKRLSEIQANGIIVSSDNEIYPPYEIPATELLEIWEYKLNIGKTDNRPVKTESVILNMLKDLKRELNDLKIKVSA